MGKTDVMILDKNTLLVYLINELGDHSWKVTTVLDDNGCWTAHLILEGTEEEPKDIENYYKNLIQRG